MKKVLICLITLISLSVSSQDYKVTPLSFYKLSYNKSIDTLSEELDNNKELSLKEKMYLYSTKVRELKKKFIKERTEEYLNKYSVRAKRLKCKGTRVRGKTKCPIITINAPNSMMYTKKEWSTLENISHIDTDIKEQEVKVSVTITGLKDVIGSVHVKFKYDPIKVEIKVLEEVEKLTN